MPEPAALDIIRREVDDIVAVTDDAGEVIALVEKRLHVRRRDAAS